MLADAVVASSGPWTLGILIGLPLAVVGLVVCLLLASLGFKEDEPTLSVIASVAALVFVGGIIWGCFPFDSAYHQWRPVSGTVEAVSHRLISTGDKTMSERYVVKIGGQPFGVDDTRAGLLKPGDHVDLACKKEWQYASESGWACRWR